MSDEQKKFLKNIKVKKTLVLITQITLIASFLLVWELLAKNDIINSFIFSSPSLIVKTIINLATANNLFNHILVTLKETLIAFTLGSLLGLFIAIILYSFKFIAKVFEPFLTMLNSLPKVALGPILIIWVGANSNSIIVMALLINLIVTTLTIYNGFLQTDKIKLKLLKSFKATKIQTLFNLVIPGNLETIMASLKLNISMSLIGVIMGEFLVSKEGIGYLIMYGSQVFNLNLVMSGIIILIFISLILYGLISYTKNKVIKDKS